MAGAGSRAGPAAESAAVRAGGAAGPTGDREGRAERGDCCLAARARRGLLLAESKKQQALSLKGSEKTLSELSEKLMGTRHSLATISLEMQPQKLDAQSWQEQDRSTVNALMSKLRDLWAQLEEADVAHAQEVRRLQEQARDLGKQQDSCLREAEELRTQLHVLEDARDRLRRELLEVQSKLRESQEGLEVQRQEAGKLWLSLGEGAKEREALQAAVKKAESERISLKFTNEDKEQKLALLEGKEAGELWTGLQEVERSRLEAWRELQELRRQMLDSENTRVGRELAELQGRLVLG